MTDRTESGAGGGYVSEHDGPLKFVDEVETGLYRLAQAFALDPSCPEPELDRYTPEELGLSAETIEAVGRALYAASESAHRAHWLMVGRTPEPEPGPSYDQCIAIARDLMGDGENEEYIRGMAELLGDMFGKPGVFLADRRDEILEDLHKS